MVLMMQHLHGRALFFKNLELIKIQNMTIVGHLTFIQIMQYKSKQKLKSKQQVGVFVDGLELQQL
jgi:hypothetical protein